MIPVSQPPRAVRAYVAFLLRHGALVWAVALLLAVPAAVRTVSLYAHLRSELEELLPRDAPSVKALDELRARMPGLQFLGVVVEVKDPADLPAAERFLDDLAARLRAYPRGMLRDVHTGYGDEHVFVEKHLPIYVEFADLQAVRGRIEARRDYDVAKAAGQLLDESEPPPSVDTSDIEKKYEDKVQGQGPEGDHISSAELKATMLFAEAGDFTTGADKARALLTRVQGDVAGLNPQAYAPALRVGYASDIAVNVEELDALKEDLSISTLLVIAAVMAVITLYFRWWRSVPALIAPLLLATVYAFALSSLPPMRVTELNSNTAFLGSIIIGNGINVGLILLARYREERRRGAGVEEALVVGVWGARAGTLAAAAAASASYASLVVTEFRGFRQFGTIGGIGMLTSWLTAFVLVPPLVKWLDKGEPLAEHQARGQGYVMRAVGVAVDRAAPLIVAAAAALAAGSLAQIARFDDRHLEHDFNKLRRADTWTQGEGYWGRKMDALLGHYLTPTVFLADSPAEALALEAQVRASVKGGALSPYIARVMGADEVLPPDQDARIAEARSIRRILTPRIRSLIEPERRKKLDRLLGDENLRPVTAADLPRSFTTGLRELDGSIGRTLLVYPRPSDALWQAEGIYRFVAALRGLAEAGVPKGARPARVAGSIPLSNDILRSIGRDAPIASAVSFLGVVAVVLLVVRPRRAVVHVLAALVLGVVWLGGAVMTLDIKINFSNFIAFPITFGIGVDYAVNVMTRYVQDGERDVSSAVRSTGGAVALCSITTIIGYSSLLLAKNRALFLFGLVAVLGELACLTAAIVVLPAWLTLLRRRASRAR